MRTLQKKQKRKIFFYRNKSANAKFYLFFLSALDNKKIKRPRQAKKKPTPIGDPQPKNKNTLSILY